MPGGPLAILGPDDLSNLSVGYRLKVEFGFSFRAWFTECTGLSAQREVLAVEEGGINDRVHQLPKRIKYTPVVLRRGLGDNRLWYWFEKGMYDGSVLRVHISIFIFNSDYSMMKTWLLFSAFPTHWTGPDLKTNSNQIAVESLELVHEGMTTTEWLPTLMSA
jgi:phage tail-like protein